MRRTQQSLREIPEKEEGEGSEHGLRQRLKGWPYSREGYLLSGDFTDRAEDAHGINQMSSYSSRNPRSYCWIASIFSQISGHGPLQKNGAWEV